MRKLIFISLLFFGLLISTGFYPWNFYWDLTQNQANSLNLTSESLLNELDSPIHLAVYSPNIEVINFSTNLLKRYEKHTNVTYEVHKQLIDEQLRAKLAVLTPHTLVINYQQHQKGLDITRETLTETKVSNLIHQISKITEEWIVFTNGHDELSIHNTQADGISQFYQHIKEQGVKGLEINLDVIDEIPDNITLVVLANPQKAFSNNEQSIINRYLNAGGHLMWLTEPGSARLEFLSDQLGVELAPGVVIDENSLTLGSPHPAIAILKNYQEHPITLNLENPIILPWSGALTTHSDKKTPWTQQALLQTPTESWTYLGENHSDIKAFRAEKHTTGPLDISLSLTRFNEQTNKLQRVLMVGNAHFLTNQHFKNPGNAIFAQNSVHWLNGNAIDLALQPHLAPDLYYQPSKKTDFLFKFGYPILLPLTLLAIGGWRTVSRRD